MAGEARLGSARHGRRVVAREGSVVVQVRPADRTQSEPQIIYVERFPEPLTEPQFVRVEVVSEPLKKPQFVRVQQNRRKLTPHRQTAQLRDS
jgi:hypothetical protein